MDVRQAKADLRTEARARRAAASHDAGAHAAARLAERFPKHFDVRPGEAVSGFYPVREEIDPLPLMRRLVERGAITGLPVIQGRGRPLKFHKWLPGDLLASGQYDVPVPDASAPEIEPVLMLVPLLAFDGAGHRLGYGAGYYDRTITVLRQRLGERLRTIGLAFEAQKVERVPHDDNDQRVDWVMTEQALHSCNS
ncbi:MAG: 5-formyltetrahydrofolate cyclo-ligase [Sphingomonadales bacterium]